MGFRGWQLQKNERTIQGELESALKRINKGTYGYCEETDEPINIERLVARPIATLSIEAQERHELKEKQFRDTIHSDR